jgi:prepilin-type N-terminal cleavage/methylation domain-containing protein
MIDMYLDRQDKQASGGMVRRSDRNRHEAATCQEVDQPCGGGRACTGCLTGNPCPACIARQARGNGTMPLAEAVNGGFTMMEMLIVIGLLGALVALILPRLTVRKTWAVDESMAPAEMMDIRRAYAAFQTDCMPNEDDREEIARYGLSILMSTNLWESNWNAIWSFPASFDPDRGKGWRGPYLQQEGTRTVYPNEDGQALAGSGPTAEIPVIHDPRHATDADAAEQRFYRVQMRTNTLYLVYVGADAAFGTGDDVAQPLEAR